MDSRPQRALRDAGGHRLHPQLPSIEDSALSTQRLEEVNGAPQLCLGDRSVLPHSLRPSMSARKSSTRESREGGVLPTLSPCQQQHRPSRRVGTARGAELADKTQPQRRPRKRAKLWPEASAEVVDRGRRGLLGGCSLQVARREDHRRSRVARCVGRTAPPPGRVTARRGSGWQCSIMHTDAVTLVYASAHQVHLERLGGRRDLSIAERIWVVFHFGLSSRLLTAAPK